MKIRNNENLDSDTGVKSKRKCTKTEGMNCTQAFQTPEPTIELRIMPLR